MLYHNFKNAGVLLSGKNIFYFKNKIKISFLQGSVLMRSAANPGLQIDWAEFDSVNRHEAQDKLLAKEMKVGLSAVTASYMHVPV